MKKWNQKYHDKFKQFSLTGQFRSMENLSKSWGRVKANKGCGGIDEVSIAKFEEQLGNNLQELQRQLKEGKYAPRAVKRVYIPKADGRQRSLGIPTIRDRIVQQALKNILEPIFEEIFLPCSHGYRPGRNPHQAIQKARAYMKHGYRWILDADIEGFFDHVDHGILMDLIREKVADGTILNLIENILESGAMEDGILKETIEGTPQGGVISPLFANIYLNHLDRRLGEEGYLLVRYADDFLVFGKSEEEAKRADTIVRGILEQELMLKLNDGKSRVVNVSCNCIEFLGFKLNNRQCKPRNASIRKFKNTIRYKTRRQQSKNVPMVIKDLNPAIRGWGNYFCHTTKPSLFKTLDSYIRGRIRCFKKKKRSGRIIRYAIPFAVLARMGLFSLTSLLPR
jgi:RNA-directed DNA polymerase